MKHWFAYLTLAVLVVGPAVVLADESPVTQIKFARELRERHLADLALEYLTQLSKNPPPALAPLLPLELAKARVGVALEKAPVERLALLTDARKDLEAFAKKGGRAEIAALTQMELARITHFQGQAYMGQAYRQEDEAARNEFAVKARQKFEAAGKELEAAEKELAKTSFTEQTAEAKLEQGKNLLDLANTYLNTNKPEENKAMAEARTKAHRMFEELGKSADAPLETKLLAVAWVIRTLQLTQEQTQAHDTFVRLMQLAQGPASIPAKRWARYFHLINIEKNPQVSEKGIAKTKLVENLCLSWLRDYPSFHNTVEGMGVKFQLADAFLKEAQELMAKDKKSSQARDLLTKAEKLYQQVADSDSKLSDLAAEESFRLGIFRMGEGVAVNQLNTFKDCFIKARYEMGQFGDTMKKLAEAGNKEEKEKLLKQRKQQLETIVAAFNRAVQLGDQKATPQDIADARFYMAYTYYLAGDLYRAAVLGEFLARQEPPGKRSPAGANYAIQAYTNILSQHNLEANRDRLRDLGEFILKERGKVWAEDPVVPITRYQLAMVALREKKHDEAIALLKDIPKDFSAYTFSQCQLALTALAARNDANDAKKKKAYRDLAMAALQRVATLPQGADSATAQMFFAAQMEQAKMMYEDAAERMKVDVKDAAKKYEEMSKYSESLLKQFAESGDKIRGEAHDQIGAALASLAKYARLGVANLEYRAGQYDKVLSDKLTGDIVTAVSKQGAEILKAAEAQAKAKKSKLEDEDISIVLGDYRVTGDLLGLAMRASVQKGKLDDAKKILGLLQRLKGEGVDFDPNAVLQGLIGELQQQVNEMRAKKEEKKLQETIKNFSAFLDALGQSKNLPTNMLFFLANCYGSLEQHQKAADLYVKVPRPPAIDPKSAVDPKANEQEQEKQKAALEKQKKDLQLWAFIQTLAAGEYRQAGDLKKAEATIKPVLEDPKSPVRLRAQKEWNQILMAKGDLESLKIALQEWGRLISNPGLKAQAGKNIKMKEFYFDCWYHFIDSWYRYSQLDKVRGTMYEQKFLERAANYIVQLETAPDQEGWRLLEANLQKLLQETPKLNEAYQKLKKEKAAGG